MISKQCSSFFILLFFSFSLESTLDPAPYQKDAQAWIEQYIYKDSKLLVSSSDLQLIANLFYFSYLRSSETIKAQNAARKAFECMWHGWQNVAHTRMNPSLKAPHLIDFDQQQHSYASFIKAQQEHRRVGLTYSHLAEAAVKQHYLSKEAEDATVRLREHARTIVAQAFLDAKKIVGDLYEIAIQGLRDPDNSPALRFDVLETISYYLPILSMQSFIEAEKAQLKTSEQSWQIISTMLGVNMTIWDAIETARASFYLAHYNTLIGLISKLSVEKKYWLIIADEYGMNKQLKLYLPKNIQ